MNDWIKSFSKDELLTLVEVYAKNWLAHDGCWFLAVEERYDLDTAMDLDREAWRRFAVAEARRILAAFDIPANGGIPALKAALERRLYAAINPQRFEMPDNNTLIFTMESCRVQETRRRKGLPDFPCKSVGIVEFSQFAKTVDPRIEVTCLQCPPDELKDGYCRWQFTLRLE